MVPITTAPGSRPTDKVCLSVKCPASPHPEFSFLMLLFFFFFPPKSALLVIMPPAEKHAKKVARALHASTTGTV
jgi:hypothetical protein